MICHGGNPKLFAERIGCNPMDLLDFSVNLHPDGMPDGLQNACFSALHELDAYPEPHCEMLSGLAAKKWNRSADEFLFGNGSSELLDLIPRMFPGCGALIVTPGYLEYAESCRRAGMSIREFPLTEESDFHLDPETLSGAAKSGELVILGNPCNPTGGTVPAEILWQTVKQRPDVSFLVDEAFADFSGETLLTFPPLPNLLILRSMTKFYAMPGLRVGYVCAAPVRIEALKEMQTVWSVGTVAVRAAQFLLTETVPGRDEVASLRQDLVRGLKLAGLKVYPSRANYLLCRSEKPLFADLLTQRILVRDCSNYPGLDEHFIRVAVRRAADNEVLLAALNRSDSPAVLTRRKKPALMLQGTCSHAGKSVLAAAFCRILLQDGYAVAPFKAQNMALNSFVTLSGGEIGRAQAVQAEACRIDPDVRMNPILLKPNSDLGSQVILLGQSIGNYKVRDYFRKKQDLWHEVTCAYDSLSAEYDCMVLEGAGSPGEINLKSTDLVNMRMALYAQSPVMLTGDIDRGGVYASFLGTFTTLEPKERDLLYGFLVNKFRGDPTLLEDAHSYLTRMTGKSVLGVIDYQPHLDLPEEDSVGFGFASAGKKDSQCLEIAVIHLGHIANFTDLAPLEQEPDVHLQIVREPGELHQPDLILIPGSKSVADDIAQLHRSGLWEKMQQMDCAFFGICGGLQILGECLLDPEGIESPQTRVDCLGLLPLETVMRQKKTLRQTRVERNRDEWISGYEIHHGETRILQPAVSVHLAGDGRVIGCETQRCFATYLHGIFDDDSFRRRFLNSMRVKKGWPEIFPKTEYGMEPALNRLADHVRSRVDLKQLYRRMGL